MYRAAGLDLAAGRGVSELAILQVGDDGAPRYEAGERRAVVSDDDILAELARVEPRVLAIDAPLSLPRSVVEALAGRQPSDRDYGEADARRSPYTRAAERDPTWSALGIRPLPVSFLGGLTFRALVLTSRIRAAAPRLIVIETFPTAVFRILGLTSPAATGDRRSAKSSQNAREALQAQLARVMVGIPSTDDLLSADTLDAIGAALAATSYEHGMYIAVGDASEGQIVLPVEALFDQLNTLAEHAE